VAKTAPRRTPAKKTAADQSAARPSAKKTLKKAAAASAPGKRAGKVAKRPAGTASATTARKGAAERPQRATGRKKAPGITPEQALENTRKLLEAKQEHDRQTPAWQQLDGSHAAIVHDGYQSDEAAAKATELHAAESRLQGTQGSISTQDRHNQGKRDSR
jgi:hypothetical protein